MLLENWSVVIHPEDRNAYTPPECMRRCLHGKVFSHSQFDDGTEITTSEIVSSTVYDSVNTGNGSIYVLGTPDPDYEAQFPNAKKRLMDSLLKRKE